MGIFSSSGCLAAAALLSAILCAAPAHAYTVIYRSQGNGSGWSANASLDRARSQARANCEARDTGCEAVVECQDGWAAVARSYPEILGFGAACGMRNALLARVVALAKCMEASNSLCATSDAFDRNTTLSADDNLQFDRTFFTQAMLQILGYDIGNADGEFGPKTRAAIEAFEADIGRSPTGKIYDELLLRLINSVAGDQRLAAKLKQTVLDPNEALLRRLAYVYAKSPLPRANYSQLVAKQPVIEQLTALATMLSANTSHRCTPPALSAELVGEPSDGTWLVRCIGGSYQFTISDAGTITNVVLGPAPNTGSQQNNQPPSGSNYSVVLAARPVGERLLVLATIIAEKNRKCTPPALSAEPFGDASLGVWNVRCADGNYQVVLLDNGASIVTDWTPLDETVAPVPAPQPESNPDPMAVIAEADPTKQTVEQIKTLTKGYEYYGQVYNEEFVQDVAFEPSQNVLIIEIDEVEEGDPLFAIIPLRIVDIVPTEFSVSEPAIAFRCDPACITTAYGKASEAIEKVSTGQTDTFWKPLQKGEFVLGCEPLRCTDLLYAIEQMAEFARRP